MIAIDFNKSGGLVPAIIQDSESGLIYMLGYMNNDAFKKTEETGYVYFYSRSRKKLWLKGEESGNKLKVINIQLDCDADAILIKVKLIGKAVCHTGKLSCFYNKINL